jgi:hypothetical protein
MDSQSEEERSCLPGCIFLLIYLIAAGAFAGFLLAILLF